MMKRIALSSRELAPLKGWGAGTYAALHALSLVRAGCEVHLFSDAPGIAELGPDLFPGVAIHRIDTTVGEASLPGYENEHFRYSLAVLNAIRAVHAHSPFDVIEFPDVGGEGYFTLQAKSCGEFDRACIALRLHLCDHQIRALNRWPWEDRWLATLRVMERSCIASADVLLAPSTFVATQAIRSVPAAQEKVRMLRYPFSADFMRTFDHEPAPIENRVLYFGRLERRKGVIDLVRAGVSLLERGVDARLILIGADTPTAPGARSMREFLSKLIPERIRSKFEFITEQVSRNDIAKAIESAAVCCFPAEADNFPFATLEAMAAERAIVTTDASGVSEILEDGRDALIVKASDHEGLTVALTRLMSDERLRADLGRNAKQTLMRVCDSGTNAAEYLKLTTVTETKTVDSSSSDTVAVVIPVWNSHHYLDQTLRSLRDQDRQPDAIVVVDDGSSDPETIRALDALKGVRLVRQKNGGLSKARNAGVHAAAGFRWILTLDSDDLLEPTFISRALRAAARHPNATVITAPMMCFQDHDPAERVVYVPVGFERELLPVWNCAGPSIAMIDRRRLIELGGYDPQFEAYEDWELWCRFAQAGERAVVLPDFLILNRIRSDSMLRTLTRERADMLRVMIMDKHAELSRDPGLTARILHGEIVTRARAGEYVDAERIARGMVESHLRYRIADQLNGALKRLGVHESLKRALQHRASTHDA